MLCELITVGAQSNCAMLLCNEEDISSIFTTAIPVLIAVSFTTVAARTQCALQIMLVSVREVPRKAATPSLLGLCWEVSAYSRRNVVNF